MIVLADWTKEAAVRGKPLAALSLVVLVCGLVLAGAGIWMYNWAHPSPHGYIETVLAIPLLALGGVLISLALLAERKRFGWPWQVFAWILFGGSLLVVGSIIALLVWSAM